MAEIVINMMPDLDGFVTTQRIREREKSGQTEAPIRLIAMTANAMTGDREKCLAALQVRQQVYLG